MTTSSSSHSHSKESSPKSKGNGKEKSDRKGSSSRDKTKSTMSRDPYARSLSNRAGLDRYVHESSCESAWSPVGAASGK